MPSYSAAQLSDDDLTAIAQYIADLPDYETHVEPIKMSGLPAMHHRMAVLAIAEDDFDDALHHVEHTIQHAKDSHRSVMFEAHSRLQSGEHHEVEHMLEQMLDSRLDSANQLKFHLRVALAAAEAQNFTEVTHHMRHVRPQVTASKRQLVRDVLQAARRNDRHDSVDGIRRLLGLSHE